MQEGGNISTANNMTTESEERKSPSQQVRSRMTAKPKLLVRSHAMREETSPPRAPTPSPINSSPTSPPSNTLIPSSRTTSPCFSSQSIGSGGLVVVLSPPVSRGTSPCRVSTCSSPTSTLTRVSPLSSGTLVATSVASRVTAQQIEAACWDESITDETIPWNNNTKNSDRLSCDCSSDNCKKCNINNSSMPGNKVNMRNKFKQQNRSERNSFDGNSNNFPGLSRDNSWERYQDTTGVDLEAFFVETLHKSAKDRNLLLQIESMLVGFANDDTKTHCKFGAMDTYQRMLVHRCAAYFGMAHNIEGSGGKCGMVVNKTDSTRVPAVRFQEWITTMFEEQPRRVLQRNSNSMDDYNFKTSYREQTFDNRRSKSFEEREERYYKLRDSNSIEEFGWSETPWTSLESDGSSRLRLQLPNPNNYRQPGRLMKVQSEESNRAVRPSVAKSFSFGDYGAGQLIRGDSVLSTHSCEPRLMKQDSATSTVSWRLSPSSSGYKSTSQRSESVTPSPISTPHDGGVKQDGVGDETIVDKQLMWAVTDIHSVPMGSVIINPETGDPYKNEDGSIYHYDPMNPPARCSTLTSPQSPQKHILSPKKSTKERPPSPNKKRNTKSSPNKKASSFINSSTSPSLPFTPTPPPAHQSQSRMNCQYGDGVSQQQQQQQQQFPVYNTSFASVPQQEAVQQFYPWPQCVLLGANGVPVTPQYDARVETPIPADVTPGGLFFGHLPDGGAGAYQQPTNYWNQQPSGYYQGTQPPPPPPQINSLPPTNQKFSFPIPGQTGFMPTSYHPNYIPHTTHSPELVPVYHQQPMQMVYPQTHNQQTPLMYTSPPPVLYTQTPHYTNQTPTAIYQQTAALPPQNIASMPNSCCPSVSNNAYCRQMSEIAPLQQTSATSYNSHLAHGMAQLSLGGNAQQMTAVAPSLGHCNYTQKCLFEGRQRGGTPKTGAKYSDNKSNASCSSQNSTGTSSSSTTLIAGAAGYSGNSQAGGFYQSPTPPLHSGVQMGYGPSYISPVLSRQGSTTGTNRNSRSPTPASDIVCNVDNRQRMSLPSALYQGVPYIFPGVGNTVVDVRRVQPNSNFRSGRYQGHECNNIRGHNKNRRPRGNKLNGLPPSGKHCSM